MKEDETNVKPKKMRELQFFCTITFFSIVSNIFFINRFIINKPVTWHTYVITTLFFFNSYLFLHDWYRYFFLTYKPTNRLKSLVLTTEIIGCIITKMIIIKNHGFLLLSFIKIVFIDVLIVLFTWSILVWFEKRRNKKSTINLIN